jgi:large subunit ribosomal protein L10
MPNIVNQMAARQLNRVFDQAEGMVIVSFGGLTVAENDDLRGNLAEKGVQVVMLRNRVARIVLKERGLDFPADVFKGNCAVAYGSTEETISAAKVLTDKELKKAGKVKVRAGVLEGEVLDAASATALADVPDRPTLQAQLLGVISGPARSLASVINAVPSSVARVLQAHADSEEAE